VTAPVLRLLENENAPDPELVETLEEILGQAKRGEILSIAFAAEIRGRCIGTFFRRGPDGDFARMIGALERIKSRLIRQYEQE
jgi:hypothetical protein